jgi:translation machinery-associated protein 16
MPSSLQKVQKHVNKKKGTRATALHEYSRDARRLKRAGARDEKVTREGKVREKANKQFIDRVEFFRQNLPDVLHPFETSEIQRLIQENLTRYDEELEQLKAERRAGRPPSTRQTLVEQARELEVKEYASGFWVPDLQDAEVLQKLEKWSGDWLGLATLRFARVDASGNVKESQFPPRGSS